MGTILYHGSEYLIENPQFGKGSLHNDYGRGFYCTENIELAKEWACGKQTNGYANIYELDMSDLKCLNLNSKEYNILNCIAEEAKKYIKDHFLLDISGYDVIIGYRADDSYFSFAQDFVSGLISFQKLSEAMRLGKLGEQIVLKSEKAFQQLKFIGYEVADAEEYYIKKTEREREARKEYRRNKKGNANINDLFMLDIMREGIQNGDARLSI